MNKFEEMYQNAWQKYQEENKNKLYPNIMLIGRSGVGKSSLINYIFGYDIAEVNDVKPETSETKIYRGRDFNKTVNLIDTAGYELGKSEYLDKIKTTIHNGVDGESVHIIWYCISVANEVVEDIDTYVLKELLREADLRKRICVIFTKCDEDTAEGEKAKILKDVIAKKVQFGVNFFETSTQMENDAFFAEQFSKLINWSADNIDNEDLRKAFVASQAADLELKAKEAMKIYLMAAGAAGIVGAVPIPFADAALLVPIQSLMVGKILSIYGLSDFGSIITTIVGSNMVSLLGKSIVGSIIKFIPGIGTVLGGSINAGVAAGLTFAIGGAVSQICYSGTKDILAGKSVDWTNLFEENSFINAVKSNLKNVDISKLKKDTASVKLDSDFSKMTKK